MTAKIPLTTAQSLLLPKKVLLLGLLYATELLSATENIRKEVNAKEIVRAAILDLSKDFDSISHENIIEKLKALNFHSNTVTRLFNKASILALITNAPLCIMPMVPRSLLQVKKLNQGWKN